MSFTAQETLSNAESMLPRFSKLLGDLRYEDRGMFWSEMLFMWAAIGSTKFRQVVESGRARGLSTAVLARLFPQSRIVSIEYEADHADAHYAEEALRGIHNLALIYGDANILLPEVLLPGDVALIDGPKGTSAVALALRALATGKPTAVFIHDCFRGEPARRALDGKVPGVFFSDDVKFVAKFRHIDDSIWSVKRRSRQDRSYGAGAEQSYGPTLACIPRLPDVDYAGLARGLLRVGRLRRLKHSWLRLIRRGKGGSAQRR